SHYKSNSSFQKQLSRCLLDLTRHIGHSPDIPELDLSGRYLSDIATGEKKAAIKPLFLLFAERRFLRGDNVGNAGLGQR
ncbi:MAG: hypothetical protein ACRC8L_04625, partial [Plesiomonas shigelloides]